MIVNFKINHIKIDNFRCFEHVETDLWNYTSVNGANETGKSSFASAILWVLTGKSVDGDSSFELVPTGKRGKVSPSVEIECSLDEKPVTLKREYKLKFTRDKAFSDYVVTTYINDIETGVRKFQEWISNNICDEQVFKILSNPRTFIEDCPKGTKELMWQAQRRLLFSILGGSKNDREIAESDSQWALISKALTRYDNANQYLDFLKKRYSESQRDLNNFDVRIDQQFRNLVESSFTEEKIEERVSEIKELVSELSRENEIYKRSQRTEKADIIKSQIKELTLEKDNLLKQYNEDLQIFTRTKTTYQNQADEIKQICNDEMKQMKVYVDALESLKNTVVKEICETCGQKLNITAIKNSQRKISERISVGEKKISELRKSIINSRTKWEQEQKKADLIMEPTYPAKVDDIQLKIEQLTEQLAEIPEPIDLSGYSEKIQAFTSEMDFLKQEYMIIKRNKEVMEEIKNIESERKNCVAKISDIQRNLDITKNFISHKCESAESSINALFTNVTFQLFEQNKSNDDVRETCILKYNGIKYDDLSYSTKIIAGLEVIKAFQDFYGVYAPIFLDNAESITGQIETNAQTFLMRVRNELCPECNGQSGRRNIDGTWTCQQCGHVWKKKLKIINESV